MDPYSYPQNQNDLSGAARLTRWLPWVIIAVALISAVVLLLSFIGYGSVTFAVPTNSTTSINGHVVSGSTKLRSGSYTVVVQSAMYENYESTINVHNFLKTTVKPALVKRDPSAVVASQIGSYGDYGQPVMLQSAWFEDNTWLAGTIGPGGAAQIALHYTSGKWTVAYFNGMDGYPTDGSSLPADVAAYLQTQIGDYAAQ